MRGKLIVVEGIDGCGKDTQINLLDKYMEDNYIPKSPVPYANVNNMCPVGKAIRTVLGNPDLYVNAKQMACLFLAELMMVVKDIKVRLDNGENIVMSRYWYSTLAYAGKELTDYLWIKEIGKSIEIQPDYLVYLDIPVDIAMDRINARCKEWEEPEIYESADKLEGISKIYESVLHMLELEKFPVKVIKVNGTNSIEEIHKEIVSQIEF